MHEIKTEDQRLIAKHAESIRAHMAKVTVQIAIHYGPSKGVYMASMSTAEGCVQTLKDTYDVLRQSYDLVEDGDRVGGSYAETIMVGLAEVFKDTLNVSIARREK